MNPNDRNSIKNNKTTTNKISSSNNSEITSKVKPKLDPKGKTMTSLKTQFIKKIGRPSDVHSNESVNEVRRVSTMMVEEIHQVEYEIHQQSEEQYLVKYLQGNKEYSIIDEKNSNILDDSVIIEREEIRERTLKRNDFALNEQNSNFLDDSGFSQKKEVRGRKKKNDPVINQKNSKVLDDSGFSQRKEVRGRALKKNEVAVSEQNSKVLDDSGLIQRKETRGRTLKKNEVIVSERKNTSPIKRAVSTLDRKSLYDKLHKSLKNYADNSSLDIVFRGNKKYTGKNIDQFLEQNPLEIEELKGKAAEELKRKVTQERGVEVMALGENKYIKHKDVGAGLMDIIKDRQIMKELNISSKLGDNKIVTAYIDKRRNLTPIPALKSRSYSNSLDRNRLQEVERMAKHIRRLEYSNNIFVKAAAQLTDAETIRIVKCVRIQRWWRYMMVKTRAIRLIQKWYRIFRLRGKWGHLIAQIYSSFQQSNMILTRILMRRTFYFLKYNLLLQNKRKLFQVLYKILLIRMRKAWTIFLPRIKYYIDYLEEHEAKRASLLLLFFVKRKAKLRYFWKLWLDRVNQYRSKKDAMKSFFNVTIGMNYIEKSIVIRKLKIFAFKKFFLFRKSALKIEKMRELYKMRLSWSGRRLSVALRRWWQKAKFLRIKKMKLIRLVMIMGKKYGKILHVVINKWFIRTTKQKSIVTAYERIFNTKKILDLVGGCLRRKYWKVFYPNLKIRVKFLKFKKLAIDKIQMTNYLIRMYFFRWFEFANTKKSKENVITDLRKKFQNLQKLILGIRKFYMKKFLILQRLQKNRIISRRQSSINIFYKIFREINKNSVSYFFKKLQDHHKFLYYKIGRILEIYDRNKSLKYKFKVIPKYFNIWKKKAFSVIFQKVSGKFKKIISAIKKLFIRRIDFFKKLKISAIISSLRILIKKKQDRENIQKSKIKSTHLNCWKNFIVRSKLHDFKIKILRNFIKKSYNILSNRKKLNNLKKWRSKTALITTRFIKGVQLYHHYIKYFLCKHGSDMSRFILYKRAGKKINTIILRQNRNSQKRLLKSSFAKWNKRIITNKLLARVTEKRTTIIKTLITKNEKKPIKSYFQKWKGMKKPKFSESLQNFKNFRKGFFILERSLIKKPFSTFKNNLRLKKTMITVKKRMMEHIARIERTGLQPIFKRWFLKSQGLVNPKSIWKVTKTTVQKKKSIIVIREKFFESKTISMLEKKALVSNIKGHLTILSISRINKLIKIQKLFKEFLRKIKEEKQKKKRSCVKYLWSIFKTKFQGYKNKNFHKWVKNSKILSVLHNGKIITDFIRKTVLNKIKFKHLIRQQLLHKIIVKKSIRPYFKKIRKVNRNVAINNKLTKIFEIIELKKNNESKIPILNTWRMHAEKKKNHVKDNFRRMCLIYNVNRFIKRIKRKLILKIILNHLWLKNSQKIKAYLRKWRSRLSYDLTEKSATIIQNFLKKKRYLLLRKEETANKQLKNKLQNFENHVLKLKMAKMMEHVYTFYSFKILKKMLLTCENIMKTIHRKSIFEKIKEFWINYKISHSLDDMREVKKSLVKVRPKNLYFYARTYSRKAKRKDDIITIRKTDYQLYLRILIPKFINYIQNKILLKKSQAFDSISKCNFKQLKKERDAILITLVKKRVLRLNFFKFTENIRIVHSQENLRGFLFKFFLMKIKLFAADFKHMDRLCNFLRTIKVINETNKKNNKLTLIKKWWLMVSMKKFQKRKITELYKKVNLMFLDMVDGLFGEEPETVTEYVEMVYNIDKESYERETEHKYSLELKSDSTMSSNNLLDYKKSMLLSPGRLSNDPFKKVDDYKKFKEDLKKNNNHIDNRYKPNSNPKQNGVDKKVTKNTNNNSNPSRKINIESNKPSDKRINKK